MSDKQDSNQAARLRLSRRGFLKGAGAVAAAPLLSGIDAQAQTPGEPGLKRYGPGPVDCELKINGRSRRLTLEPRVTLLQALRDQLDMTGAKEVCDRGGCGACTVLLDGKPVNACLMLALDAIGYEVTTIEGLGSSDKPDAVPAAFAKHDALQCGFCTPGLVMSVRALLNSNSKPTPDDVRAACAGNLCRCGTYPKVFAAALEAAGVSVPVGNEADNKGKALQEAPRVDGLLKATGQARYTADVSRKNMAYAAIVYCPFGRANLKSYNEDAAKKVPGVLDVSIRKRNEYKYCGQPTGHVCAETRQALDDGIAALKLEWELLAPAVDAVAEHDKAHGPIPPPFQKLGDKATRNKVQKAFDSAKNTVERTYVTQVQTHACLEPHCAVGEFRGDSAEMWCSNQALGGVQQGATSAFGLESNKVQSHCEFVGGGFGSKFGIDAEGALAAELSKKLKRPVKVVNNRKREHLDTGCRPGSIQHMKFALDEDGKPTGGQVYVVGITGPGGGGGVPNPSRYNFGPVVAESVDQALSIGSVRPMRAPGHPQGMFAVDSFVDELALAAGVDPLEYRKRIDPNPARLKMYDVGAERIGWSKRPKPDGSGEGTLKRGIGVGVADWGNGPGFGQVRIDVHKDGTLKVVCGVQDIGTGTRTVLADVVADHLKIDRKLITADCGNSEYPPGPPSGGSVVTRSIVPAIRDAAQAAKKELKKRSGGEFTDTKSWVAECAKIPEEKFTVVGKFNRKYWGEGGSEAVQFVEVEVDVETGQVRVVRVVALQACGQPINRLAVENQIIGGVIQGVSFALFEEKIIDPRTGAMVNPNMEMYKILGAKDCPEIITIIWKEGENLGARSIGEPPVIPTAGAVANAVANAIGRRVRSLPITPARVLAALSSKA